MNTKVITNIIVMCIDILKNGNIMRQCKFFSECEIRKLEFIIVGA